MNQSRLMNILLEPKETEKTVIAKESNNSYAFRVIADAKKPEIKKAVETILEVKVDSVRTSNVKGRPKRYGMHFGKRPSWKKAIVTLKPGESIELIETE